MSNQAAAWDAYYASGSAWKKETLDLPKVLKGKQVLELGVGNGKTLQSILRQHPSKVIALDISAEALWQCKKEFGEHKKVHLIEADACALPFEDESFDVIVCYYLLNALDEAQRKHATEEMKRVLASEGVILFEDIAVGDFRESLDAEKSTRVKAEQHTFLKKDGRLVHYLSEEEVQGLFSMLHIKEIHVEESTPIHNKPEVRRVVKGVFAR